MTSITQQHHYPTPRLTAVMRASLRVALGVAIRCLRAPLSNRTVWLTFAAEAFLVFDKGPALQRVFDLTGVAFVTWFLWSAVLPSAARAVEQGMATFISLVTALFRFGRIRVRVALILALIVAGVALVVSFPVQTIAFALIGILIVLVATVLRAQ